MPKTLRYNNTIPGNIYYNNTKAKKVFYNNTLVWSSSYEKFGTTTLNRGAYFNTWQNKRGGSSPNYAFICSGFYESHTDNIDITVFNSALTKVSVNIPTNLDSKYFRGCGCEYIGNYMLIPYLRKFIAYNLSSLTYQLTNDVSYTHMTDDESVNTPSSGNINHSLAIVMPPNGSKFTYMNTSLTGGYFGSGLYYYSSNIASIFNMILIGNIAYNNDSGETDNVKSVNASLTITQATTGLSIKRHDGGAESINNYAIFAGGESGYDATHNNVDIFNTSLTRIVSSTLNTAKKSMAVAHSENYAMFASKGSLDIYDTSLTYTNISDSDIDGASAGISVGDYILFAGGLGKEFLSTVQIYSA